MRGAPTSPDSSPARRCRTSVTRVPFASRLDLRGVHQVLHQRDPAPTLVARSRSPRASARGPRRRARTASRLDVELQLDRPVAIAVGVLDRVVARLADREHDVGRLGSRRPAARSSQPRSRRRVARAGSTARPGPRPRTRPACRRSSIRSSATSSSGAPISALTFRTIRSGSTSRARRDHPAEQVDPVVDVLAAPLDQAVRVHREHGVVGQRDPGLDDVARLGDADRRRACVVEPEHLAGRCGRRAAAADARRTST